MADDPEQITAWQRLDERTTTSGRLVADDIPYLAEIGVRHVINLALDDSPGALVDEAALLAAEGIRYTHIPIPFDSPDERHFEEFCQAIEDNDAQIHVHCMMNYRVSAFFYRYNRDIRGVDEAKARALMEQQWSPDTSQHPDVQVWARFIAMEGK